MAVHIFSITIFVSLQKCQKEGCRRLLFFAEKDTVEERMGGRRKERKKGRTQIHLLYNLNHSHEWLFKCPWEAQSCLQMIWMQCLVRMVAYVTQLSFLFHNPACLLHSLTFINYKILTVFHYMFYGIFSLQNCKNNFQESNIFHQ